jgi:serine/threonine protein kinase
MELIDGRELFDYITSPELIKSFTTAERLYVLKELALGIKEFHDHGLTHRDIKPENVMIVRTPEKIRVIIIDYGFVCNNASRTVNCSIKLGSPAYMDPQAMAGDFDSMKRADWWAFGQILCIVMVNIILYDSRNNRFNTISESQFWRSRAPQSLHKLIHDLTNVRLPAEARPSGDTVIRLLSSVSPNP